MNHSHGNYPEWKHVTVTTKLPKELKGLEELSYNLWYVWNYQAGELFELINPELWAQYKNNPMALIENTSAARFEELVASTEFMAKYNEVLELFRAYMSEEPDQNSPTISYFSMEYGLSDIIKIYSGGLGVLAGDYLKEASDCNVRMTAVGFLYRYGYFTQTLSMHGDQQAQYDYQHFNQLPYKHVKDANGDPLKIYVSLPGRNVAVYVWKLSVGRVDLLLLDSDLEENSDGDRFITHQLYGGDWENRLKQEVLLGFGGIQALEAVGVNSEVYHCNEGHAAFINLARLDRYINNDGLSYKQALEVVRASSLFTTHTPVPAGHDSFDEGMMMHYFHDFPSKVQLNWDEFMALGHENDANHHEKFSMSNLAAKTSQEMNGVSWLHGKVSQEMFKGLWPGYMADEQHINYVTNGVHYGTWTASEWQKLYEKHFDKAFKTDVSSLEYWEAIYKVDDAEIWETKADLKSKLIEYIKFRFKQDWLAKQGDPRRVVQLLEGIRPDVLTIGFGRRFATYKRAHLLFNDIDRLSRIINDPDRPVQFLFTGKAHPADGGGQGLIKHVIEVSRRPEFLGKIIFLENYDMRLARRLISGVDVWLNTPTRPLEASGTSGQKAELNGTLNLSVLDGWWYEGYRAGAGWALTDKRTYQNQEHQDQLDAATLYSILENQIVPTYYDRDENGVPVKWVEYMKNSLASIAPVYTTKRMLDDYKAKFYNKMYERTLSLKEGDFAQAKEMVDWKQSILSVWNDISVEKKECPNFSDLPETGVTYAINVQLDTKGLAADEIGLEIVQLSNDAEGDEIVSVHNLDVAEEEDGKQWYRTSFQFGKPGNYKFAIRMFPNNDALPNRQDFALVRWI